MYNGFFSFFRSRKNLKLGLYGPPNGGKTTLANAVCRDMLGEEFEEAAVSNMAHETRQVYMREKIELNVEGRKLMFNLVDTPGIATKIDYEDFIKAGMSERVAKKRAKEATKGVIESIKWLDDMDSVVVVLDSTKDPYSQVNITILGNLAARNIPVVVAANKVDLKRSNMKRLRAAFPQYKVVGVSAKYGNNLDELYKEILRLVG
jgi:small GTP-binding protein